MSTLITTEVRRTTRRRKVPRWTRQGRISELHHGGSLRLAARLQLAPTAAPVVLLGSFLDVELDYRHVTTTHAFEQFLVWTEKFFKELRQNKC
jgi:hypothetical protein